MSICAVILAGGNGSRLWPMSRQSLPKQFLPICEETTMLQSTFLRLSGCEVDTSIVICNEEHRFFVAEQFRDLGAAGSFILEPVGRNTAPAIAIPAKEAIIKANNLNPNNPFIEQTLDKLHNHYYFQK